MLGRTRRFGRATLLAALGAVVALVAIAAVMLGPRLIGDEAERDHVAEFYTQPEGAADGAPGTLVRSERLDGALLGTTAWRIMYRTRDVDGRPVVATGIVATPDGTAPHDGRTVLAWAHPTTGVADACTPSRMFDPYLDVEGIRVMLDRGYTVVATDYVGMGTEGPDSYLVGVTAGNSVLDSVRAARALDGAHAGSKTVLWGHSQGGQAVLFAAERAKTYAPELTVLAAAVAAPAADLTALLGSHLDDLSGTTIGSYAFSAYSQVYAGRGARLDTVLTPAAIGILPQMNALCLLTQNKELHRIAAPVVGTFFAHNPESVEPWATLLRENSAGGRTFTAPLFVAQGAKDKLVLPADTERFVAHEKQQGMNVTYHSAADGDHGTVAYLSLPALTAWLNSVGA
ncbi:alpha/beta fold hydrolase [Gordonia spumicola]|uniref:alpha/beta fold hydrolase n=1 Tax=Gordonia spumicola TaxID=589161 RepID=UPI001E63C1D8|nr:alpha/beta fold hydrolase [Gordonia spumicola]